MRLDLTENENWSGVNEGAVSWLGLGMALEDAQWVLSYLFLSGLTV
jgi:hypothetical protein